MLPGLVAAALLAGCGSASVQPWTGPPRPDADGRIAVEAFNDYLGDHEEYASSPEALASEFLGLAHHSAAITSIVTREPPEGGPRASVAVVLDGLPDDSVRSARYLLTTSRQGDSWRLDTARGAVRCRVGRGHLAFSTAPCV